MEQHENLLKSNQNNLAQQQQKTKNLFFNRLANNDSPRRSPLFHSKPAIRLNKPQAKFLDKDYSLRYDQYRKEPKNEELEERILKLPRWKSTEKQLKKDLRISEEKFEMREVFPKTVNSIRLERLEEVKMNRQIRKTAVENLYDKIKASPKFKSVSQQQSNLNLLISPKNPSQQTLYTTESLTTKHKSLKDHITELLTKKQGIGGKAFVFSTDVSIYENRLKTQKKHLLKDQKLNFYRNDKNFTDLIRFQEKYAHIDFISKEQTN